MPYVDFKTVKERVTIEELLNHYGLLDSLKRNGDTLTGQCPIHKGGSKTTFKVSLSKNIWNCFGPCRGGNILDFVAELEKVEIRQAALLIAERFGVKSAAKSGKTTSRPAEKAKTPDRPAGASNPPLNFASLKNLDPKHAFVKQLGFKPATIEHFGAGYCTTGLMKGRIAIPIHNAHGELVAYAGKATKADEKERYKYPDGFRKDLEVYNLHRAAAAERSGEAELVITTGFLDVFRIHEAGYANVVALMGYGVSPEQLTLLHYAFGRGLKATLFLKRNGALSELLEELCSEFFTRLVALDKHPGDLSISEIRQALS